MAKDKTENEVVDFDIPAGMDLKEYIAQQVAQGVQTGVKEIQEKNTKSKINEVKIGLKLMDKEAKEGAVIIDKQGVVQKDDNGNDRRYPTKYFATFAFMGGSIVSEVKQAQFDDVLETNNEYFCKGYLGEVKEFAKTVIKPIFTNFELLTVPLEEQ